MIGAYIVVEYDYVSGANKGEGNDEELLTTVYYPENTDRLYEVLDEIVARRGTRLEGNESMQLLEDIVDVHIIEDVHWIDDYVSSRSVGEL